MRSDVLHAKEDVSAGLRGPTTTKSCTGCVSLPAIDGLIYFASAEGAATDRS